MGEPAIPDVMLLAAGLGTRMRPLTDTLPKPLVAIAGTPLIDRVAAAAVGAGCRRFVVNAHHHADLLARHVGGMAAQFPGTAFALSPEPDAPLGTGGGVRNALPLLRTDPFLVMNTDAFWQPEADAPVARMTARFAEAKPDFVLLCVHPRSARGFRRSHDFCLAPDGRITRDRGAPVIYAGVALIARAVFDGVPDSAFSMNDLFVAAEAAGRLQGVVLDAHWFHVGDVAAIAEAEAALSHRPDARS